MTENELEFKKLFCDTWEEIVAGLEVDAESCDVCPFYTQCWVGHNGLLAYVEDLKHGF